MKTLLLIALLFPCVGFSQMQVKADSIIEMKGQRAKLTGLVMGSNERVYFVYFWRGAGRIELLNYWFTIHEKPFGKRKVLITKNE